jgi:hypothetical protein
MDLESVLQFLPFVIPLVTAIVGWILGYYLGLRSQRIQSLQQYVIETVKEQYPPLLLEVQRNSEYLDGYLEKPFKEFQFSVLTEFLKRGLGALMKKHHADLFQSVSHFSEKIKPSFEELNTLRLGAHEKLYNIWQVCLYESLPAGYKDASNHIAGDLIRSVGRDNVLTNLLIKDRNSMAKKVERCIDEKTGWIREKESKAYAVIGIPVGEIDYQKITESLIEKANPTIEDMLKVYAYLKEQNDTEIKRRLLPLFQKYISNPI